MRKNVLYVTAVVIAAGFFVSLAMAGNGNGPGDGTGVGPCVCETSLDIDPADGICDICGGCIPEGDGPKGPNGSGNGDQIRDGSCLTTSSAFVDKTTEMKGGNGKGGGDRKRDGSGGGKGGGDRKRDGSCKDPNA